MSSSSRDLVLNSPTSLTGSFFKKSANKLMNKSLDPKNVNRKLKRRYITRLFWLIAIVTIILCYIFMKPLVALITSFSIIAIASLINILLLFISPKKLDFSIDAYVTIIISYSIALTILIIVPLDLSVSLNKSDNTSSNENIDNKSIHDSIDLTWNIIYWTSILVNFIFMRFQIAYWSQGHSTVKQKIIKTLKGFIRQLLIITFLGLAVLIFLLFKYLSLMKGVEFIKSIIQVLNSLYCIAYILFLLGYGLVQLPFYFYSYTHTSVKLKMNLQALSLVRDELETGVNQLLKDKSILLGYCFKYTQLQSQVPLEKIDILQFAQEIIGELSNYNYELNDLIGSKNLDGNIKDPKIYDVITDLTEDHLAQMLITVKNDYYYCVKKEGALLKLYSTISSNCEILDDSGLNFQSSTDSINSPDQTIQTSPKRKKNSIVMNRSTSFSRISFLLPKNYSFFIKLITKIFAFFLVNLSIIFLVFQINLIFLSKVNFVYLISSWLLNSNFYLNYFFIFFYFSYFFICSFYSLSNFRFFEVYILVPHHTNKFGMAYNASMCNTIILGICYNILYFYSFIYDSRTGKSGALNALSSASALNDFFASMKKVEFVYGYYNYFFPLILILIVTVTVMKKFHIFKFYDEHFGDMETEFNNTLDKEETGIISEDTFFDHQGNQGKIKFEILEKIQEIYYGDLTNNNEEIFKV